MRVSFWYTLTQSVKTMHTTCFKAMSWGLPFVTDSNSYMHRCLVCEETEGDTSTSARPVRDMSK